MSAVFWLIVAGLLLLAVALLVLPLLGSAALPADDAATRNLGIAREQLGELRRLRDDGQLTPAQFEAQYRELLLDLGDELDADAGGAARPAGRGRWMIPVLVLCVPLFSLGVYFQLSDPDVLAKAEAQQQADASLDTVRQAIPQIIARLKQRPDDVEGWLMLGKSYSFVQDYRQAAQVYAKLDQLSPDQPVFLLLHAEALAMVHNGMLAGDAAQLVFKAVKLDPGNRDGLWMAAIASLEAENQAQALAYLRQLEALLPADAEAMTKIRQMIAELAGEVQAQPAAVPAVSIPLRVALDPAIARRTAADATLFVYAQAVDGPKMPLAIVRKQVADLPLNVTLDDSMAMTAGKRLGDYRQLRLVARISASGQAMARPGDFIGEKIVDLPVGAQPVNVTINQEVK